MGSVECPEQTLRSTMRRRQRIDRSGIIKSGGDLDQNLETHKNEDTIGIRFPVLNHLLVLFRRQFQIH